MNADGDISSEGWRADLAKKKGRRKYNNVPTESDVTGQSHVYDSSREAQAIEGLVLMERSGEIILCGLEWVLRLAHRHADDTVAYREQYWPDAVIVPLIDFPVRQKPPGCKKWRDRMLKAGTMYFCDVKGQYRSKKTGEWCVYRTPAYRKKYRWLKEMYYLEIVEL